MSFTSVYVPSLGQQGRGTNWLGRNVDAALKNINTMWWQVHNTSTAVTFDTTCTIAMVRVPKPPSGYKVFIEGWVNGSWESGSPLDAVAKLKVGSRVLGQADLYNTASAGCICPHIAGELSPSTDTNVRLVIDWTASRTALNVENRGICARYVKEG
jgi:hypothetical protein